MNTRTPVDLGTLTRSVSIGKVREIVNEYRKQGRTEVFTSDVIRGYAGHFLKNTGSSPALSFNANFGKILQANAPSLHIAEIRKHVSIRDDAGESTSSSEWKL